MVSKLLDDEIVIASHNKGKIVEFVDLFKEYKLNLSYSEDYNIEEPEENGSSFEENSLIRKLGWRLLAGGRGKLPQAK